MKRRIIINADDFGWDADASQAILDLADENRIDSTTVMANMVVPGDLVQLKTYTDLSIGIHINLSSGKPLSSARQVGTLINPATGSFYSSFELWKKYTTHQIKPEQVSREIQTQLDFLQDHGVQPSHADSHQHIHIYPGLGHLIQHILKKKKINKVRNCHGAAGTDRRRWIIKGFNQMTSVKKAGFVTTDALCSAFSIRDQYDLNFFHHQVIMNYRKASLFELMAHPAVSDRANSPLHRKAEYDFLRSERWPGLLEKYELTRTNWRKV